MFQNSFVEWSNDETIFAFLAGEILFFAKADAGIQETDKKTHQVLKLMIPIFFIKRIR